VSEVDDVLTASVQAVKAGVPELTAYDKIVTPITVPAVIAIPPDRIDYDETMDGGATMMFTLRLLVSRTQDGADQEALNAYMSRKGTRSVKAALEADPRLGGTVSDVFVNEAGNYGNWPVGGQTYLGFELRVKAMLG
jgi:hypothetical protein